MSFLGIPDDVIMGRRSAVEWRNSVKPHLWYGRHQLGTRRITGWRCVGAGVDIVGSHLIYAYERWKHQMDAWNERTLPR